MNDRDLEKRLRQSLSTRAESSAPSFDSVYRAAEHRVRARRRRRGAVAAAAGIGAVAIALLAWFGVGVAPPPDSTLVAELTRTTSWKAPSDAWRPAPRDELLRTLPEIGTTRISEGDRRL